MNRAVRHAKRRRSHVAPASLVVVAALIAVWVPAEEALAATRSAAPTANGEWAGVGKICEAGPGGASSVRGVGSKAIRIAVFNDESNTAVPGLEKEFLQFADAFASWCNASGGIDGRKLVIDDRDGALFNAAQVTNQACQSDFMAVGGGLVLDQSTVPVREACGLGQVTGYTVSDAADSASLQVNPSDTSPSIEPTGFYIALAKAYPSAVKEGSIGALNIPSALEPEEKWRDAAESEGWKIPVFQEVPETLTDWTPYMQQLQTAGVEADQPAATTPQSLRAYLQAMITTGFRPQFILLGSQFYSTDTLQALEGLTVPPVYLETNWWPLVMASQSPGTEQLVQVMHRYGKGETVDFNDEIAAASWLLWAKSASACGANLTVACVLNKAQMAKDWSAGGMQAPVAQVTASNNNPQPSPCFVILRVEGGKFIYDKSLTGPTQSIWNCSSKNNYTLTPSQLSSLTS